MKSNGRSALIACWLLLLSLPVQAQRPSEAVQFIQVPVVIDGELDKDLRYLRERTFTHILQFDNPPMDTVQVTYRLGYTASHLYVYIEAEADSITYRDRGFINGDGFKLLLGMPKADTATNEYYELAFSPSRDHKTPGRARIREYNREQDHGKELGPGTMFEGRALKGRCGFEAWIAWADIGPYHPWSLDAIGYNLYFAKAIGQDMAHGYAVVADEGIWDEEVPRRNYALMEFEVPVPADPPIILARPQRKNLQVRDELWMNTVGLADTTGKVELQVTLRERGVAEPWTGRINMELGPTLKKESHRLAIQDLAPGMYTLEVRRGADTIGIDEITVLPDIAIAPLLATVEANGKGLPQGTVSTLLFELEQLRKARAKLKAYEKGEAILAQWAAFQRNYRTFLDGRDPYLRRDTVYRRAFRSVYDGTYQPYSVKLPKDYDPRRTYPLLVFLHGSGQDEQRVLCGARSGGRFIELAPFARDMYRCYSSDSAQNDILEAIDDVCRNFSVDRGRMIIAGFSMGGYGALRTYYAHPGMYRGVAVFAGHPQLAGDWLGTGHPDFLRDEELSLFTGVPVFVYHGRQDGALPVEAAEALVQKLNEHGARVTARIVASKAHAYPDEATNRSYFAWLDALVE